MENQEVKMCKKSFDLHFNTIKNTCNNHNQISKQSIIDYCDKKSISYEDLIYVFIRSIKKELSIMEEMLKNLNE